jgi:hypothetical protein
MGGAHSGRGSAATKQAAQKAFPEVAEHTALFHCFPASSPQEARRFIEAHLQRFVLDEGNRGPALGLLQCRKVSDDGATAGKGAVNVNLFQSFFFVESGEVRLVRRDGKCVKRFTRHESYGLFELASGRRPE